MKLTDLILMINYFINLLKGSIVIIKKIELLDFCNLITNFVI